MRQARAMAMSTSFCASALRPLEISTCSAGPPIWAWRDSSVWIDRDQAGEGEVAGLRRVGGETEELHVGEAGFEGEGQHHRDLGGAARHEQIVERVARRDRRPFVGVIGLVRPVELPVLRAHIRAGKRAGSGRGGSRPSCRRSPCCACRARGRNGTCAPPRSSPHIRRARSRRNATSGSSASPGSAFSKMRQRSSAALTE